ncbi:ABC transporter ATP-binding protein [Comamonas piscis]|uniref:ABC transporter ATP-binding protein n=1 Tax=Comamonas piscis TaxID=1562974 RepID=A0A7G5EE26_9BURK|nr:ABC transporter ATP-binding protein [Comamonas piscis]QMV72251.1 ABC transporter ATP-binding protein [Comamonas piscis]WSO35011.1 ABC transporter ATP-binding protein [Comamonas piscis]
MRWPSFASPDGDVALARGSWLRSAAEPYASLAEAELADRLVSRASPVPAAASPVPAGNSALLEVDRVSIDYVTDERVLRATHQVSLQVHAAERFVLLGASGCGKSTLLKAMAGFVPVSEGAIRLGGKQVAGPGPDRVMVFQEFDQLPPWKTVRENVMFPLLASRRTSKAEARERADLYLDKVGLSRFADVHPHQLSGGMKQRVAIARALAMHPQVLLMDEPFAALDALTRRRMQEELLALWEELRFTLVFVTHSIEEALVVGSRVAILSPHPGRLRAEINAHAFGLASGGSAEFEAAHQRIHRLLFDEERAGAPSATNTPPSEAAALRRVA